MYDNNENNFRSSNENSYEPASSNNSYGNSESSNGSATNPYNTYNYSSYQYNQPTGKKNKTRKDRPVLKKVVSVACCGILFGVLAGAAFSVPTYIAKEELLKEQQAYQTELKNSAKETPSTASTLASTGLTTANNSSVSLSNVQSIAEDCLPCVVSITNKGVTEVRTMFGNYQQASESSGSGIIIGENANELLIVTNYHVVSDSSELSVVFSYDEASENPSLVSAKIKGYDAEKDLAVIAIASSDITDDMRSQIKIATIGDSTQLSLGQQVVAIGNALGYGQSVTTGIISALNREVSVQDDNGNAITNKLIQTDAAINPGNSGGALLNMNGQLIGINSVKVASSEVEGMGYAIPISDVQSIIEELMLKETRDPVSAEEQGYLGVQIIDVSSEITQLYDIPTGAYVSAVTEGSPADIAGITKRMIITKLEGQTIRTKEDLVNTLAYYRAGETVSVKVYYLSGNGYEEKTISVTLGDKSVLGNSSSSQQQQQPSNNNGGYGNGGYDNGNGGQSESDGYNYFWPFGMP